MAIIITDPGEHRLKSDRLTTEFKSVLATTRVDSQHVRFTEAALRDIFYAVKDGYEIVMPISNYDDPSVGLSAYKNTDERGHQIVAGYITSAEMPLSGGVDYVVIRGRLYYRVLPIASVLSTIPVCLVADGNAVVDTAAAYVINRCRLMQVLLWTGPADWSIGTVFINESVNFADN